MFEEEGFSDIEKAAFERSLSAPSVQGYSFNHSEESGGNSFGNKDFFHTGVNSGIPRPERAATSDNFESSEFRNSFIFDDNNLEKFDNFESSRLKSLIINEDSDMESPLDLIQKDFPSTPSDIFGHKSVTVDDSQSQENSSTGHSSPPREKTTSSSSILDQDNSEVKDELADVLDDIDQCMYVTEPNSSESNSTEASNNQQSNLVSNNFQQQQYPPNQQPTSYPQYSGQQPSQQGFQMEGRNQPNQQYSNYPQEFGYHSQQMQFQQQSQGHSQNFQQHQNQGHSYHRPKSDSSTLQSQQQQLQQGLQMPNGYNVTGRGQTVAGNPMPLQHNVYDLGNGQSAMVGGTVPGVALGIDHQSPYFVNVMPNGPQQPVYIDPYFQSRMGMPNSGAFPQVQTNGSGEGMGFVQFGHIAQPNGVGSYWPHGAVINSDTGVPQNAVLMQQPGQQGPGVYLQHDPNQFNPAAAQVGQQPMNVFPMAMGSRNNLGNHGYPQQNIQGHFVPQSPVRASGIQGSLSPSKPVPQGSQSVGHENANDTFRQDNGGVDVMGNDANGSLNRLSDRRFAGRSNSAAGRGSPTGSGSGANNNSSSASRDAVVEDFRNTYGKGRQWEIQDLVGHVVAFCQDQHGSRFIQQRLEVANDADKQIVFDEVLPSAHSLMTDVFGNYVIQKLFEFGTPDQCETLAALLMGQAVPLALQMYGCRVIQKALEYVATERLVALVGEFEGKEVLRCVHDQNGNHVIQKCIEVVSKVAKESAADTTDYLSSRIQFIIQAFSGRVRELSMHPYGCRVVQRILEHCSNTQKAPVLEELRKCCRELIQDQYGNYVIQHVMQHGWETDKAILIDEVQSRLLEYSQHKFASNVVEKCIQYASKKDRDQMIWTIINVTFDLNNPVDAKTGQCVLENMVRDPYANYVVQKVIDVSDASQRGAIIRYMRENIVQLRRYTYGKHIIIRLEKVSGEKF